MDYRHILRSFIESKNFLTKVDEERKRQILSRISGEKSNLPDELNILIEYILINWNSIDAALIWGSYVAAEECAHSFFFDKDKYDNPYRLLFGPSDLDCLLVTNSDINNLSLNRRYTELTRNLESVRCIEMNVFRDVFLIPSNELQSELRCRNPAYVSCYLSAFYWNGVTLKGRRMLSEAFYPLSIQINYRVKSIESCIQKRKMLESYL